MRVLAYALLIDIGYCLFAYGTISPDADLPNRTLALFAMWIFIVVFILPPCAAIFVVERLVLRIQERGSPTSGSSVILTRVTSLAGQEPRRGSESAEP